MLSMAENPLTGGLVETAPSRKGSRIWCREQAHLMSSRSQRVWEPSVEKSKYFGLVGIPRRYCGTAEGLECSEHLLTFSFSLSLLHN